MKLIFLVAFVLFFFIIGMRLKATDNMKKVTEDLFGIAVISGVIAICLVLLSSSIVNYYAAEETVVIASKPLIPMNQKIIKRDVYIQNRGNWFNYWYWKDGLETEGTLEYCEMDIRPLDIEHPTPTLVITDTRWRNPLLREIFGYVAWDHYNNTFYVPDAYVYMLKWGNHNG